MPNDPFYGVISAEPLPGAAELTPWARAASARCASTSPGGRCSPGPTPPTTGATTTRWCEGRRRTASACSRPSTARPSWASLEPRDPAARLVARRTSRTSSGLRSTATAPAAPSGRNIRTSRSSRSPIWQLWNEPNSPLFWKPKPDARQYLTLLRAFHSAVKGADPTARILLGGLFPTPTDGISSETSSPPSTTAAARDLFDAVALHPYARTPRDAIDRVAQTRRVLRRFGDADKPIWITEVGWASSGTPPGLVVGPAGQADYVRQTFELAADASRPPRDRRRDLVLAQRHSGADLGRALRALHGRRFAEAGVAGVHAGGGRRAAEAGERRAAGTVCLRQNPDTMRDRARPGR